MKNQLFLFLAQPRGFCGGVARAIETVETALQKYGGTVYVRHQIVHNKHVVDSLKKQGAIFVNDLSEIPDGSAVIFSAHGVAKEVYAEAEKRGLKVIDAICPLVDKVHKKVAKNFEDGVFTVLIGHKGHPEIIGTMGQVPPNSITLISTKDEVLNLPDHVAKVGYVTQTTLSADETGGVIEALKSKYPNLDRMNEDDICFATSSRQRAVKAIAPLVDHMIVIGSSNSSNSRRLQEVAAASGCSHAILIDDASEFDMAVLQNGDRLGITSSASAPEYLVTELIDKLAAGFELEFKTP